MSTKKGLPTKKEQEAEYRRLQKENLRGLKAAERAAAKTPETKEINRRIRKVQKADAKRYL